MAFQMPVAAVCKQSIMVASVVDVQDLVIVDARQGIYSYAPHTVPIGTFVCLGCCGHATTHAASLNEKDRAYWVTNPDGSQGLKCTECAAKHSHECHKIRMFTTTSTPATSSRAPVTMQLRSQPVAQLRKLRQQVGDASFELQNRQAHCFFYNKPVSQFKDYLDWLLRLLQFQDLDAEDASLNRSLVVAPAVVVQG